jgi:hypothetical protein
MIGHPVGRMELELGHLRDAIARVIGTVKPLPILLSKPFREIILAIQIEKP